MVTHSCAEFLFTVGVKRGSDQDQRPERASEAMDLPEWCFTLAVKYTACFSIVSLDRVGGVLTALWLFAKKLSFRDQLNLQTPFIRIGWKPLSSSRLIGLTLRVDKHCEMRGCFSRPAKKSKQSPLYRMRLRATKSTREHQESNHPGMNTCTKIGGGATVSAARPCLSRRPASTIFLRRKPREDSRLSRTRTILRQSAAQIQDKERELEQE